MKIVYVEYGLIMLLLFTALDEVQGKSYGKYFREEGKRAQENFKLKNMATQRNLFLRIMKENNNLKYTRGIQFPPATLHDTKTNGNPLKSITSETLREKKRKNISENRFKAAKSFDTDVSKTTTIYDQKINKKENHNFDSANQKYVRVQKVYCRQITRSEPNNQINLIENVQHICAPLASAVDNKKTPQVYNPNAKHLVNFVTSTPKGINCRRIMNSELNEMGEIVDTVTQVCDTPTTTTRKPITTTTAGVTTTTPKPLIKICNPVMDSYLNEKGEIIDSVKIICKMEAAS